MNSQPNYVKPLPFQNSALTIGYDTSKRIVLDPKQELTVDPVVTGNDEDEMSISHLCSRASLIYQFDWSPSALPLQSTLFSSRINPALVTWDSSVTPSVAQPSAMAYAVAPFTYWRGDITYRFEIVVSKFHRGKIAVFYEPNTAQYSIITANTEMNKQFMRIIDIQETQCFEVCVNWASHRAWLLIENSSNAVQNLYSPGSGGTGYANGFIMVVPFTELQSPDGSVVSVNVYAYSDNMMVNGLSSVNMPSNRNVTATDPIVAESGFCGTIMSQDMTCYDLNPSTASQSRICEDHFGEQPLSYRAILKRFNSMPSFAPTMAGGNILSYSQPIIPPISLPFGTSSFPARDILSYLRYGYLGLRGGMRWRVDFNAELMDGHMAHTVVSLSPPGGFESGQVVVITPSGGSIYRPEGTIGHVLTTNGGVEFECPMYTNNMFLISWSSTLDTGTTTDNMEILRFRNWTMSVPGTFTSAENLVITTSFAAGEDFCLLRFQGSPPYSF